MSTIKSSDEHLTINADGSSKDIKFQANASEKVIIKSDGKVGIGTSSPSKPLEVKDSSDSANIRLQGSVGYCDLSGNGGNGSDFVVFTEGTEKFRVKETGGIRATDGILFGTDTASANTLDDYEEGTYTYTITGSSGGSMTPRSGYNHFAYTKIGRLVTVQGRFETSGSHTASGVLYVSLPFSSHDGVSHSAQGAGVVSIYRAGANFNNVRAVVRNNSSQFEFYYNEGGTGDSDATVQGSDVDATMEGSLSITYMT